MAFRVMFLVLVASSATAAPLKAVKTSISGICAIQANDAVVCTSTRVLPEADVPARDLAMMSDLVVRPDGTLVRIEGYKHAVVPIAAPFKVQAAGVTGLRSHQLCALGERGELACGDYKRDAATVDWKSLPGKFADVRFNEDEMFALDDRGALWCAGNYNCGRFARAGKASSLLGYAQHWPLATVEPVDAAPFHVADGVAHLYDGNTCFAVVGHTDRLVCADFTNEPHEIAKPVADEIVVAGSMLCARTGAKITCELVPSAHDYPELAPLNKPPTTFEVKDAVKLYGGSALCVETKRAELLCSKVSNPMVAPTLVTWATRPPHAE